MLPTWTENGTIVWPGTFPRGPEEATFVERDEATLYRRSPYERLVTPEPGGNEAQRLGEIVRAYRARAASRERRARIVTTLTAMILGALWGAAAALAAPGHAYPVGATRAAPPPKVLVHTNEGAGHRAHTERVPIDPAPVPDRTVDHLDRTAAPDHRLAYRAPSPHAPSPRSPARGAL